MDYVKFVETAAIIFDKGERMLFAFAMGGTAFCVLRFGFNINSYGSMSAGLFVCWTASVLYRLIETKIKHYNEKKNPTYQLERLFERIESERSFQMKTSWLEAKQGKLDEANLKTFIDFCDGKMKDLHCLGLDDIERQNAQRRIDEVLIRFKKDFLETERQNMIVQNSIKHAWMSL